MRFTFKTTFSLVALTSLVIAGQWGALAGQVHATNPSNFNPGNIISDGIFTNEGSMNATSIQRFLESKNSVCLKNFKTLSLHDANGNGYGDEPYGRGKGEKVLVSTLISQAAQIYNINPKVILVTLQKEQGLITRSDCPSWRYNTALGYGCPDSAPCNDAAYGFTRQIDYGVWHFRGFFDDNLQFVPYVPGKQNIAFHPDVNRCGGGTVNIQNRATASLYSYTPYQPNQASLNAGYGIGNSCSSYGNRNFWLYFNDWFGNTQVPYAFKTAGSSTIYLSVQGSKVNVPSMAMLQDYGVSPRSVKTISKSLADGIPATASPLSPQLSSLVKSPSDQDADGGTVYLTSVGKRYAIKSMSQLENTFGFAVADISYMPLDFIKSIPSGGALSNFIQTPGKSVFKVAGSKKRIIFDFSTYKELNPSDAHTPVSSFVASKVASDKPISSREILVQKKNGALYLLTNGNYYALSAMDQYHCWGFQPKLKTPMYGLAHDSFIGPITNTQTLSCLAKNGTDNYMLDGNDKYALPPEYGVFNTQALDAHLTALTDKIPVKTEAMTRFVKSKNSPAVWYLEAGKKKAVPSLSNLALLGISVHQIDVTRHNLSEISSAGIKLGAGQAVKSAGSATVYVVSGNHRIAFAHGADFLAHGFSWGDIESYPSSLLNQHYPTVSSTVNDLLFNQDNDQVYLMSKAACYRMPANLLSDYGYTKQGTVDNQNYDAAVFHGLQFSSCKDGSAYIKEEGKATVYWVSAGAKHPVSSWSALLQKNSGSSPPIMKVQPHNVDHLASGSTI